jgi:deazaflavin-dependent oxidoreductase (nitroreductase family)
VDAQERAAGSGIFRNAAQVNLPCGTHLFQPPEHLSTPGNKDTAMSNQATHKQTQETPNDTLRDRLSRFREINITVTGRKSGRKISIPVWFVWEDDKLYLLPVQGSDTQWYKNVLTKPSMRINARGAEAEVKVVPVIDAAQVASVVEKFRAKYGASDVKKYYKKFDAAVLAHLR